MLLQSVLFIQKEYYIANVILGGDYSNILFFLTQETFVVYASLSLPGSARATQHIMELPLRLRSAPSIKLALSINQAFLERNPVRLLRLAQKLDFLQTCAVHRHLATCHRDLLLLYSHGHSSRNCRFPLDRLAELLFLDASLTAQLCRSYGIEVNQDNQVEFSKAAFKEPEKLRCKLYHSTASEKQRPHR